MPNQQNIPTYSYPFGMEHEQTSPVPTNGQEDGQNFKYNGKESYSKLGWIDYGARMYNPSIGRWMSVDPLAEKYMLFSPYNYVANNPIKFIDPDGKEIVDGVGNVVNYKIKKNGKIKYTFTEGTSRATKKEFKKNSGEIFKSLLKTVGGADILKSIKKDKDVSYNFRLSNYDENQSLKSNNRKENGELNQGAYATEDSRVMGESNPDDDGIIEITIYKNNLEYNRKNDNPIGQKAEDAKELSSNNKVFGMPAYNMGMFTLDENIAITTQTLVQAYHKIHKHFRNKEATDQTRIKDSKELINLQQENYAKIIK